MVNDSVIDSVRALVYNNYTKLGVQVNEFHPYNDNGNFIREFFIWCEWVNFHMNITKLWKTRKVEVHISKIKDTKNGMDTIFKETFPGPVAAGTATYHFLKKTLLYYKELLKW